MAWILDTAIGNCARGADATIKSTKARHSSFPVASNSRNDRTRDTDQSMAATTQVGQPLSRALPRGYPTAPPHRLPVQVGVAARAVGLRAVLTEAPGVLSLAERYLLDEWLDRLITRGGANESE